MPIQAISNVPGKFSRTRPVPETQIGELGGNPYFLSRTHDVYTDYSYKSILVKGDHDGPTPYQREVMSILTDRPGAWVELVYRPNGDIEKNIMTIIPISTMYPTGSMSFPPQFYAELENAYSKSVTKALMKLRSNTAQIGAAIFEAKKTAEMIASQSLAVLRAYQAARRGNFAEVARQLGITSSRVLSGKHAANMWLQTMYGWLPLLVDIKQGCDRLAKGYRDKGFIIDAHSTPKFRFVEPWHFGGQKSQWIFEAGVRCAIEARIKNSFLDSIDGSGVLNPLSIAWELVPYSFVIDWFVPVGNVLESLTATAGLEFASGYTSTRYEGSFHALLNDRGPGTYITDPGELEIGYFFLQRQPMGGFPLPRLYAKDNPFTSDHIKTAVALMRQLMGNSARH